MDRPAEIAPIFRLKLGAIGPDADRGWEPMIGAEGPRSWSPPRHGRPIVRPANVLTQLMLWARTSLGGGARPSEAPVRPWSSASVDELLQALFDSLQEEVALIDERGVVMAVNAAWRAGVSDVAADGGVGAGYLELCASLSVDLSDGAFRQRVADVVDGRSRGLTFLFLRGEGASLRPRQVRLRRVAARGAAILLAIHEDAGRPTAGAAASTAADLLTAQDEERQRIAMELHDSTSQHLVALGMGVARLRRMVGEGAQDVLEDISRSVAEVVKEIRVLSFLMRPPGLDRQQLEAAARTFVRGFGMRTGLGARFEAEGPVDDATPATQHAAFRILQEALSNAFRHADATAIDVRLALCAGELIVRISDDGRGIAGLDHGDLSNVQLGVGIVGMQARVAKLGGRLELSCEGGGTQVLAVLPMASARA